VCSAAMILLLLSLLSSCRFVVDSSNDIVVDDKDEEETDSEEKKDEEKTEKKTEEKPKIEYDYEWQVQKKKVVLKIRALGADVKSMSREDIKKSHQTLLDLDDADEAIRDTSESFNTLETFILERRPYLREDEDELVMKVSTEEEREELVAMLNEAEEWLYDEEEPSAGKFKSKLRELQKKVQPVFTRAYELSARPSSVKQAREFLITMTKVIQNMTESMTWVNKTEFEDVQKKVNDVDKWITNKVEEQEKRDRTEKPAFFVEDLKKKTEKVGEEIKLLSYRPKPKEKKKKKKRKKKRKKGKKAKEEDSAEGESDTAEKEDTAEKPAEEKAEDSAEKPEDSGETTPEETEKAEEEPAEESESESKSEL